MKIKRLVRKITWGLARTIATTAEDWLDFQVDPGYARLVRELEIDVQTNLNQHDPMGLLEKSVNTSTEYTNIARIIATSLMSASTVEQVDLIVQSVMVLQFFPLKRTYPKLSQDLFELAQIYSKYKEYQHNDFRYQKYQHKKETWYIQ